MTVKWVSFGPYLLAMGLRHITKVILLKVYYDDKQLNGAQFHEP